MIWIYLTLVVVGAVITVRLARQHSRRVYVAGLGVVLAIGAVLTGFSIGPLVAPVAGVLILVAAAGRKPRDGLA